MVCKHNWHSQVDMYLIAQRIKVKPEYVPSSLMASISALLQPDSCPWLMTAAAIKRLRPKKDPPLMRTLSASASLAFYMADSDCTCTLGVPCTCQLETYLEVKIRIVSQCMSFKAGMTNPLVVANSCPVALPEQAKHSLEAVCCMDYLCS